MHIAILDFYNDERRRLLSLSLNTIHHLQEGDRLRLIEPSIFAECSVFEFDTLPQVQISRVLTFANGGMEV